MSLDWNLTGIQDHETVCWQYTGDGDRRALSPSTHILVYATVITGMDEISTHNATEFFARIHAYERVFGAFRNWPDDDGGPAYVLLSEVLAHIGLVTNASRMGRQKFYGNFHDRIKRDADAARRREEVTMKDAARVNAL